MRNIKLLLYCGMIMLLSNCKSTDGVSGSTGDAGGTEASPPATLIPWLQKYYIGTKPYDQFNEDPQYDDEQMMRLTYVLHGSISIIGTLVKQSQNIEGGVTYIDKDLDHQSLVFDDETPLSYVSHNSGEVIATGTMQGEAVNLRFVNGNFRPVNNRIFMFKKWFTVTASSLNAYLDIAVVRRIKEKSTTHKAEGRPIGTSTGNDQGNNNSQNNYPQNNYPQDQNQQQYTQPNYNQNNNGYNEAPNQNQNQPNQSPNQPNQQPNQQQNQQKPGKKSLVPR